MLCVIAGYIISCFNSHVSSIPCVIRNMCLSTGLCSQERVSCVFFGKMLQVPASFLVLSIGLQCQQSLFGQNQLYFFFFQKIWSNKL